MRCLVRSIGAVPTLQSALWGVVCLIPLACGGGSGPEMARVSGKVSYKGEPVPRGTISFQPVDDQGTPAIGNIGSDGSYSLQTINPGDGARVGQYQVAISTADVNVEELSNVAIPGETPLPQSITPEKYANPQTSGLTATVESGRNTVDFDLE